MSLITLSSTGIDEIKGLVQHYKPIPSIPVLNMLPEVKIAAPFLK
jgi:hypothetical protein